MRLQISESKNAKSYYVVKSTYVDGKHSSKVVEKLGTYESLREKLNGGDPDEWAKEYVRKLTKAEKERTRKIMIEYSPVKTVEKGERRSFNGGYLFLQKIYHELGIHNICREISERCKFGFNLDGIMSRLLYARMLFPSSKRATTELSERFMEPKGFELQHVYRALEAIARESDFIQAQLYRNSLEVRDRKTGVLYYDCTNYFFEIEQEEGMKQYGYAKDHKPNPLVQMGLFMDADGIPLAFGMSDGNTNEQVTLRPLEEKIIADFNLSRFVVCTDAGLSSTANRKFNDMGGRAFITTQPVKRLKPHIDEWVFSPTGWRLSGSPHTYDISKIESDNEKESGRDAFTGKKDGLKDKTFYKERWINEDGLEQRMVVTYSIKYRDYQRKIRDRQVGRAERLMAANPGKLKKARKNDYKRFIERVNVTPDGEVAGKELYSIDKKLIKDEERFDGFYASCTNLGDDPETIAKVNHRRWEIEECFRIMKSEFRARPVFLQRDDRIKAHFLTCFMALLIYRLLEKRLGERFTCPEIIGGLRDMNFLKADDEGYIPAYMRTDFTDALHEAFGFRTDYEIVTMKNMKKIFKETKK